MQPIKKPPEIIPVVISGSFEEIKEKIRKIEPYVKWVQIDVVDGVFAANKTWNNPAELKKESFSAFLEMDLMIVNPFESINRWIDSGAKRILMHVEAIAAEAGSDRENSAKQRVTNMAEAARNAGVEFGLSLNIETSVAAINGLLEYCDSVMLLAVPAGFGGQKFDKHVFEKISALRKNYPQINIEVDGGINPETAHDCVKAGANVLASGSYIFNSADPKKAIEELKGLK